MPAMIEIGKYNDLTVVKAVDFGLYLDGGEIYGEILIPGRYVPEGTNPGDTLHVFIYMDSEDRIIATTEKPVATVGEFTVLKVVSVNKIGAFLDWGLPKDVLLPFREQKGPLQEGDEVLVYLYYDKGSRRIAASSRFEKFLGHEQKDFQPLQEVELLIAERTDMGYKALIDGVAIGVLYHNEIHSPVKVGDRVPGFINKVREDDKIDLWLQKPGFEKIDDLGREIMERLKSAPKGFLPFTDKSPSEDIMREFHASKKTFKKSIGQLYKFRKISITEEGIKLTVDK